MAGLRIPTATSTRAPLANDLAARRVGDMLYLSGVIAVDPLARSVVTRCNSPPMQARQELPTLGCDTGQLSIDVFEAPAVAQSWFVLSRIQQLVQAEGGRMADVFKLVQYFRDLRHYPADNRVRGLFCPDPVDSTVVEVSRMLPDDAVLLGGRGDGLSWGGYRANPAGLNLLARPGARNSVMHLPTNANQLNLDSR